jgi:hypothetical protein
MLDFLHNCKMPFRVLMDRSSHAEIAGHDTGLIRGNLRRIGEDRAFLSLIEVSQSMQDGWLAWERGRFGWGNSMDPASLRFDGS